MKRFVIIIALTLGVVATGVADELDAGRKLYVSKCARCHKFYDPTAYNDAKWEQWMEQMRKKTKLSDGQYQLIAEYLQAVRAGVVQSKSAPANSSEAQRIP